MKPPIKVILIDDHAVVRAGCRMLLLTEAAISVIAEADKGELCCELYQEKQPDVVVMDLSMPGIGGLDSIRRLCKRYPEAKIVVFSVHDEHVYVRRALDAGAKGYVTKHGDPAELINAILAVARGHLYVEPNLSLAGQNHMTSFNYQTAIDTLSNREFDVFVLLAKGLTVHKIAAELCLGYKTVANYSTQIKIKLKVATVAELAHIAIALNTQQKTKA